MKNKLLLFNLFFLILLALPVISSQIYQQETIIDLKIPFEVNGSAASSSAICNISIKYPNSTHVVINQYMTNLDNGEFNYTLSSTETSKLGEYEWVAFCCDGTSCAAGYGSFEITITGNELSTGEAIVYIIFLIAIIFVFSLCLFGAIKIPFKNPRGSQGEIISINDLKYLKIFLIVLSYLLLMFIFGITRSITANYLYLNGAHKVFQFLFFLMFYFTWPIIVCSLIFTFILFLTGQKMKKILSRGVILRGGLR